MLPQEASSPLLGDQSLQFKCRILLREDAVRTFRCCLALYSDDSACDGELSPTDTAVRVRGAGF